MIFTTLQEQFRIAEEHLSKLNAFTLRIYKDIFNKRFEVNEPAMSYWFAPIIKGFKGVINEGKPEKLLDWAILDYVNTHDFWKWDIECPHDELENRYLVDKWDGGRRFWSIRVLPNLSPQDPVPEDAAPHHYMNTIIDYTVSLFSKSRQKAVWRQDQPVIFAHRILHRLNWLDEYTEEESKVKKNAYVCPEPLLFSAVGDLLYPVGKLRSHGLAACFSGSNGISSAQRHHSDRVVVDCIRDLRCTGSSDPA